VKAAVIHEFGSADVLKIEDLPAPVAEAGEVLVRVHAVRVGGLLDIGTRAGRNPFARLTFPHVLGADFAGEVVETGDGVTGFKAGQRVVGVPFISCGVCPACQAGRDDACPKATLVGVHRPGSYAELVAVPAKVLRHIPDGIGDEQAAAMAVSGPVAFTQFQVAAFRQGDWVLVTSAASGLGLVTALVAKELGARVIATSRKEWKRDMLKGHGLDGVLDNTSSADMFAKLCLVLAPLGRIVSSGALVADTVALDIRSLYLKSQSVIGVRTHTQAALDGFWKLVATNGMETRVDRVFRLDEVADAHRYVEAEKNFGRVLLKLN